MVRVSPSSTSRAERAGRTSCGSRLVSLPAASTLSSEKMTLCSSARSSAPLLDSSRSDDEDEDEEDEGGAGGGAEPPVGPACACCADLVAPRLALAPSASASPSSSLSS